MKRNLAYYHALPYTKVVEREEKEQEAYFVVRIEELPGCIATGRTRPEALLNIKQAFDEFIEAHLDWGNRLAEPARQARRKIRTSGWKVHDPTEASGPAVQHVPEREMISYGNKPVYSISFTTPADGDSATSRRSDPGT